MKYLLDTHVWIWWNSRPEALSPKVRKLLSGAGKTKEILLSAASVWEFCKLLETGRLELTCSAEVWIESALDWPDLRLVPLTPRIAYQSTVLPGGVLQDPNDQIIAATAREEKAVILTKDPRFSEYRHVKSFW